MIQGVNKPKNIVKKTFKFIEAYLMTNWIKTGK